jgi:hypothetical protein
MHLNWLSIISLLASVAIPALGAWFIKKYKTPTDLDRAQLLAHIAEAAAALVVSLNPKADWATLLQQVVQQIASAAGLPTNNAAAINRAAALALTKVGVQAPAGTKP